MIAFFCPLFSFQIFSHMQAVTHCFNLSFLIISKWKNNSKHSLSCHTIWRHQDSANSGFRSYNVFESNCEDFAIYCKTSLLVVEQGAIGHSGQATSIIGGSVSAILATPLCLLTTNVYGIVATGIGLYCRIRYATDIGMRKEVEKVAVEDLSKFLPRK
ncbi:protein LEAD-SENSITIVE 1-like [Macadamia integrifolia]|uniref:protein LEAD-SENSITIVE 1-like n=1 Tax=Macadamia integrifolia TaxID=60698 RepID=UPI001C4FD2B6|nr:protein LEAD-SENSITIVE 1-like [Macadamia integrifolia]